jgi:NTE family protein
MAVRALALSGGGAHGSFQLGALGALYDVYGFRPDVIAGTSVGSINGIKLALAQPPAVNDPAAILASVAAGQPDSGLTALRSLEALWEMLSASGGFFTIKPVFAGTVIQDLIEGLMTESSSGPPLSATLGGTLDLVSGVLGAPIVSTFAGPWAADFLQKVKATILAALTENGIFTMNPVSMLLNDEANLTLADLAAGTPLYMATVALESGRLRYIDGMGTFTERDGRTPVLSELQPSDIARALDENLNPLSTAAASQISGLLARYLTAIDAIRMQHAAYGGAATAAQRAAIVVDIGRNTERARYLLDALHTQIQGLHLTVNVDPRRGVLASAAIPMFFEPIVFGGERYVDGGLRELIPMEIAIRSGVTDIVGISCSPLELPVVDDMTNAGLLAVALRASTGIAINEVGFSDIAAAHATGITCTVIAPSFDVHPAFLMDPSLLEISSDYGWLRGCDELQPAADLDRPFFRLLADLITTFRVRSNSLENYIVGTMDFYTAPAIRDAFVPLRTYRWLIRELLAARADRSLPQHPRARRWWTAWARDLGPVAPTNSIWSRQAVFSTTGVEIVVADQVADPDLYAPDSGSLVDGGNDRVYWIVRGAVFLAAGETEASTAHAPVLAVPHGTMLGLPRVPGGTHVMRQQDSPTDFWIVHNGKRYQASPGLISASGLSGRPVAIVPPGGLAQIPDGGSAYWLGGLYIADSAGALLERWEPTPQVEGHSSTTHVGLMNRSGRPITVSGLTFTSSQDTGASTVLAVTAALPLTIQGSTFTWVDVRFTPAAPGPITGSVSVTCDDPTVGQFSLPLATSGVPLGSHGLLQISSAALDFGAIRVGQTVGTTITLSNAGTRELSIAGIQVTGAAPAGQFAVANPPSAHLAPGASASVSVSSSPTVRGRLLATLSVDASSATDTLYPFLQHLELPLTATGRAPKVFLAALSLVPPPGPGGLVRHDFPGHGLGGAQLVIELSHLDFLATAPGTTSLRTLWVRNVGDAPLSLTGLVTSDQTTFGFPAVPPAGTVIPPGGELGIDANFLAPSVPGTPMSGQLEIHTDDPMRPVAVLAVSGRAAGAHLSPLPREVLNLNSGQPPTGQMILTSDGSDPVALTKFALTSRDFSVSGFPPLPATLTPGTALTISVAYNGTVPGQHDAYLELDHDGTAKTTIILKATT